MWGSGSGRISTIGWAVMDATDAIVVKRKNEAKWAQGGICVVGWLLHCGRKEHTAGRWSSLGSHSEASCVEQTQWQVRANGVMGDTSGDTPKAIRKDNSVSDEDDPASDNEGNEASEEEPDVLSKKEVHEASEE